MSEEGKNNESITEQMCFSGPLTVVEIRKILSMETDPAFIERRATISDLEPSRKIYPEFSSMDCFVREHFFTDSADAAVVTFTSESPLKNHQDAIASSTPAQEADSTFASSFVDQDDENLNESLGGVEPTVINLQKNDDLAFNSTLVHSAMPDVQIILPSPSSNGNHHDSSTNLECDESLDESSCSANVFNDTIEEMERAVRKGLNYLMPGEGAAAASSPPTSKPHLSPPTTESPNPITHRSRIPISSTKVASCKSSSLSDVPINLNMEFKIPSKPVTQHKTPNFKSIVSPVGMYIRNSPRVPQVQHVVPKPLTPNYVLPKPTATNRLLQQDVGDLPCRLYKPAKRTVISESKELTLPESIRKLIPHTPEIIKHEGRLKGGRNMNGASVEAQLLANDLTGCFEDSSLMNSSMC